MQIMIRRAGEGDLEAMVGLLIQLFTIETDFAVDPERHLRGLKMMLDGCGRHRCVLVAECEGVVAGMGMAQLVISTAEGGRSALIEDVVVDAGRRGLGIGHRLLGALEAWALAQGATRMQLLADRTNVRALYFYHRQGWLPTRMICLRRRPDLVHYGINPMTS